MALFWVRSSVTDALSRDVTPMVERSVVLFDALRTAQGDRYRAEVVAIAAQEAAAGVYGATTTSAQAVAAFEQAQRTSRLMGEHYPPSRPRPADLVVFTNVQGRVLARNVDARQEANRNLAEEFEAVGVALRSGNAVRDYLRYDGQKWFDVVFAPVRREGAIVGLLGVGYELSDSVAAEDASRLGAEVGYLVREGDRFALQSLSFGTQTEKTGVLAWANGGNVDLIRIFNSDSSVPTAEIDVSGHRWRVSGHAVPGLIRPTRAGAVRPGFVVLRDLSAAREPSLGLALPILYLALFGLLLVLIHNIVVSNSVLQPIEVIEEGLLRIINGDQAHRLELQHPELGGIVYRINQLVQTFTGEEESDDSGRVSKAPPRPAPVAAPAAPVIDESAMSSTVDPIAAQRLGAEPEAEYYTRLRAEYLQARKAAGLGSSDGLSHEQFVEMVRASEGQLAQKYGFTSVRFTVGTQGSDVLFKPVPLS
ncbi:MAG: MXAN_5187 C-terminal domain-containing protein [Deltaproteobacteria bacterium]|nr:MXAN_5187 C-terminal domain-containing protein [Deltaproteobacteria bacterium]